MTTDAPTPVSAPPVRPATDELPRPNTFAEAIKALRMMAGKRPDNRLLPETRDFRSGDLRKMADLLELWSASAGEPAPAEIRPDESDSEPRSQAPEGDGHHENGAPDVATLERVRDALTRWADPFVSPCPLDPAVLMIYEYQAPADPFVNPANPLDVWTCPRCGGHNLERDAIAVADGQYAPGLARCHDCESAGLANTTTAGADVATYVETQPPTSEGPPEGGEPLPKGVPGAAPGTFATAPQESAPVAGLTEPEPFALPRHYMLARSPSQVLSFHDCGVRYRLERVERVSEIPAWWNIGGNAFHETVRWWEFDHAEGKTHSPDETARKFELAFADELAKTVLANLGKNMGPNQYRAARGGTEDRDWWRDHGPTMAADYVTGQLERETEVLRLSPGALALELGFTVSIGGIDVKGFLDQALVYRSTGAVLVRDYKTGSRLPDDPLQLQIYAIALRRVFGIDRPIWGAYWRARRSTKRPAGETAPIRIDVDDIEPVVAWRIAEMDRAERAGVYTARPSSMCSSCGVRGLCPVMGPPETRRLDLISG